jgi:5,10-methenyltetrahydrofolate synthetase
MNEAASLLDREHLKSWRSKTRKELIARRMAVTEALHSEWSGSIGRHLDELLPDVSGLVVGFCWPYMAEYDPRATVLRMLARGASAALPVIVAPGSPLAFRAWSPGCEMEEGAYGIPIPAQGARENVPDLVLLPANGFDEHGFRLGYGAGYFDRTLASQKTRPVVIGISFELGRLATIRPHPHDIPLDYIVTEAGAWRCGPAGLEAFASGLREHPDRRDR